jgi:hypothetical protein
MRTLKKLGVIFALLYIVFPATLSYSQGQQEAVGWLQMASKWRDVRTRLGAIRDDMLGAFEAEKSYNMLMVTDFIANVERICRYEEQLFGASAWMDAGNKAGYYDHRARLMKDAKQDVAIYLDGLRKERRHLKNNAALSVVDRAQSTIRSLLELFDQTIDYMKGESARLQRSNTNTEKP